MNKINTIKTTTSAILNQPENYTCDYNRSLSKELKVLLLNSPQDMSRCEFGLCDGTTKQDKSRRERQNRTHVYKGELALLNAGVYFTNYTLVHGV
jgi:hypothetical protein